MNNVTEPEVKKKRVPHIYMYGVGDETNNYAVLETDSIDVEHAKVAVLRAMADVMRNQNDDICAIYIIDQSRQLYNQFADAYKHKTTFDWLAFRETLERDGHCWWKR